MHIRFSCDMLEVIWTSYACSVYTACKESICVTLRKLWFNCSKSESHKFSALFEIGICQLIQRFFRNSYFPKYLLVLLQQIKIFRIAFFSITNTKSDAFSITHGLGKRSSFLNTINILHFEKRFDYSSNYGSDLPGTHSLEKYFFKWQIFKWKALFNLKLSILIKILVL